MVHAHPTLQVVYCLVDLRQPACMHLVCPALMQHNRSGKVELVPGVSCTRMCTFTKKSGTTTSLGHP